MIGNRIVYWIAQFTGWMLYALILLLYNAITGKGTYVELVASIILIVFTGILFTHAYRYVIIRYGWLNLPIHKAVLVLFLSSITLGIVCPLVHGILSDLLVPNIRSFFSMSVNEQFDLFFNWVVLTFVWSILYFTTHYFANYKKAEITNLKMLASQNEIELINLKSQLNPHFIFNALNSIRALVDEDPLLAKTAITQLSSMLRGSLQTGRRQLITLDEELSLVKSYLAIEKIRFEERLKVVYNIDPQSLNFNIPPLMIQTLVENAVKHGISSLTKGGELHVETHLNDGVLEIVVRNSGTLQTKKSASTGIGLINTEKRLSLLYGKEAGITIRQGDQEVISSILIPKNLIYENIDN
ncbi:MAG: histidine kinase [Bacteroidota bacterium]